MNAYGVLARSFDAGAADLDLTDADVEALAPHVDLLRDLYLLGPGARIEAGETLRLSMVGHELLSQLADLPKHPG